MAIGGARLLLSSAGLVAALRLDERHAGPDAARTERYVRRWAHAALRSLRVEVLGAVPAGLPSGLVVANHRSFVDIPLLLSAFGGPLLSRADVEGWPVLGKLASIGGTIYVDRSDRQSGASAVRRIVTGLRAGRSIGVFAEGTTFADDEVRPFLPGAFLAARQARRPIVPVGLAYAAARAHFGDETFGAHAQNLFSLDTVRVALVVGELVEPSAKPDALAEITRQRVQAAVHAARRLL